MKYLTTHRANKVNSDTTEWNKTQGTLELWTHITRTRREETRDRRQETGDRRQETGDRRPKRSEALRQTQTMRQGKLVLTHLNFKSTSCHFWFTISDDSLHQKLHTQEHKNKHTHAMKKKGKEKIEISEVEKITNLGKREWLRHLHKLSGRHVLVWTLKFEKIGCYFASRFLLSIWVTSGPKLSLADGCL